MDEMGRQAHQGAGDPVILGRVHGGSCSAAQLSLASESGRVAPWPHGGQPARSYKRAGKCLHSAHTPTHMCVHTTHMHTHSYTHAYKYAHIHIHMDTYPYTCYTYHIHTYTRTHTFGNLQYKFTFKLLTTF